MNPFFEFFKKLSQGFFFLIQRMIGEQHAARYLRENLEVMQQAAKTAAETIDLADQLAVGNNPDKQRLAALIKDYANEGMKQVLTGQLPAEEVRAIESPGRSGWFPTQTPHKSVLARLTHTAPRFKPSLRDGTPSGRRSLAGAGSAPADDTSVPRRLHRRDGDGQAISSRARSHPAGIGSTHPRCP
jgi:hypothetical protein